MKKKRFVEEGRSNREDPTEKRRTIREGSTKKGRRRREGRPEKAQRSSLEKVRWRRLVEEGLTK